MAMTLPPLTFRRHTGIAARWPFLWLARKLEFNAQSEQVGTYIGPNSATVTDSFSVSGTTGNGHPTWSYNATQQVVGWNAASGTQMLTWPWLALPQKMCGMVDFIENATVGVANAGVFDISDGAATGARVYIVSTGTYYQLTYNEGGGVTRLSTMAVAPANGDRVRLRWQCSAVTSGVWQLYQSINGAAETTGSTPASRNMPLSWIGTKVRLNVAEAGDYGANTFLGCVVTLGNQTEATLLAALA